MTKATNERRSYCNGQQTCPTYVKRDLREDLFKYTLFWKKLQKLKLGKNISKNELSACRKAQKSKNSDIKVNISISKFLKTAKKLFKIDQTHFHINRVIKKYKFWMHTCRQILTLVKNNLRDQTDARLKGHPWVLS